MLIIVEVDAVHGDGHLGDLGGDVSRVVLDVWSQAQDRCLIQELCWCRSKSSKFTFETILIIRFSCWSWRRLPERSLLAGINVDFSEVTNVDLVRLNCDQNRLPVHSELLRPVRVGIVHVLLEGNTERHGDDFVCSLWKYHTLCWRFANEVLVVEDLSLDDQVVLLGTELAPGILS